MAQQATLDAFYELTRAKARFCDTLDTRDWAGFGDLMTDDVVLDVSEGTGVPVVTGRAAAVDVIRTSLTNAHSAHHVHTPLINLNGDGAEVIWAMQDRVAPEPEGPTTRQAPFGLVDARDIGVAVLFVRALPTSRAVTIRSLPSTAATRSRNDLIVC